MFSLGVPQGDVSIFRVGLPQGDIVHGSTTKEAALDYARRHLENPANALVNEGAFLGEYVFDGSSVLSDGQTGLQARAAGLKRKMEHGLVVWNLDQTAPSS